MKTITEQQKKELAEAYKEANQEIDHAWEVTVSDGIEGEDWSEIIIKNTEKI